MTDNTNSKFDDAPVSGGGLTFEELLEKQLAAEKQEQCQAQTDLKLPLPEKIKNKNWKVRKSALDEISSKVNELSSFDPDLFKILSQILTDSHQGNLEEAVNILNSYLEKDFAIPKESQNELNLIIKLLIEKCFSSSKQALKDKSKDMIISFVEYLNNTDILVENLITLMKSKNQKMSQGAVSITTILLSLFGSSSFNYKKISSAMTTLSDKCSPLIKQNIIEFFLELYKWIKKLLKPLIEKKVKDIIKNDIEKGIEQINEQLGLAYMPEATKFLGKKNGVVENEKNTNIVEIGDIEMKDETEVDIFTKKFGFDEKFIERMMKPECKWNEKKKAFDQLTELINPEKFKRKIKNTNRLNFMDMVKRLLKQPNQNVRHSIIKCMGNLAIGLGTNFTNEAKELIPRIIDNFAINKLVVTNDLIKTLINFSNIIDDNWVNDAIIKYGTKSNLCNISKNNLLTFIEKLLDNKKSNNSLNCYINTVKEIVIKYMDDHSQEIRNKSTKLMVYIKSTKFNLYNNNIIKQTLNEQKIKKIEEFDKTEKKMKKDRNINQNNNNINIFNNENINNNNKQFLNKKISNLNSSHSDLNSSISEGGGFKKNANKGGNGNPLSRNENKTKSKLSSSVSADNILKTPTEDINLSDKDDIINLVKQNFGEDNVNLFDSKKWQDKKEGFTNLNNYFMNNDNAENLNSNYDYYLKFILIKNKSFKENNILILKESFLCINTLIKKLPSNFSKKYYNPLIKLFIERISERKIHQEAIDIIVNLIEKTSPKEILLSLMRYIRNKTAPILNGGATIINNLISPSNINSNNNKLKESIHLYPIKEIIEFSCFLENNTNSQCRISGANILCSLYAYMGNSIKILLKDLKESTLKVIEEKFEKIPIININNNSTNNKGNNNIISNNNIIEQVFPRVDISKKITPNLIKELNEGKWTNKKETIKAIENIIYSANNQIQSKGLNELFNCIKFNLNYSNKNIVKMIMKLIEELCQALGSSGFRHYQRYIIPGIISNFSDKNTQVKEEAIKCLEKLISIMGFDSIACFFPSHLNIDNYETRYEILSILNKNIYFISNKKEYIKEYTSPLINCLLDKNGVIRSMAEKIVEEIVKYFGISIFNDAVKNLKNPTILNQIKTILKNISNLFNENNKNINISINNNTSNNNNEQNDNNTSKSLVDYYYNGNEVNDFKNDDNHKFIKNNIIINQNPDSHNFNNLNKNSFNTYQAPMNQPFHQNLKNNNFTNNHINLYPIANNNSYDSVKDELSNILKQIYSSNVCIEYQALNDLQLFLQNNENLLSQKNIEEIFVAFNTLLSIITKNIESNIGENLEILNIIENNEDMKLLKNLLDVYYYLSNQYNIMSKLNNEVIVYECYERLFIIITEKSLLSYQNGTILIQKLNSIIMNFFNYCNASISIVSLIKIILNYKSNTDEYGQICTLAIKGLDKFRNFIFKLHNILDLNKIFECFYHFFSEFEKTNENLIPHNINEENSLAMINAMISEFIKLYGDKIWEIYNASLNNEIKRNDIYLQRSIQQNLREYKNNNFLFNSNLKVDKNFNIIKNDNMFNNLQKINNDNNNINIVRNQENIIKGKNNFYNEDQNDIMIFINKVKEKGKMMSEEEKKECYNKIVSLLKANNQPISIIFAQLDMESSSKIYDLYHSFIEKNSSKNNNNNNNKVINNNSNVFRIALTNGQKNKSNENNSKFCNYILTDQGKRIQEYRNKYKTLTDKGNNDIHVDIFSNASFKFKNNENDENKSNNSKNNELNDLHYLEKRKKEIDDIIKTNNEMNSKSIIFKSQSDIPQANTSFFTNRNIITNNSNYNFINDNNNSKSSMELAKYMRIHLDHIRNNLNKQKKNN